MSKRTHYQVLGVQPDAEDLVIKAAYRALAQRYHPDRWDGDKALAQQRMAEINAAYAVLSDPVKRREYDAELKSTGKGSEYGGSTPTEEDFSDYFRDKEEDWIFATRFFPSIKKEFEDLGQLNIELSIEFKIFLLETKRFKDSKLIYEKIRSIFMERYFGQNPIIGMIAEAFFAEKNLDGLHYLNKAVRILGESLDPYAVAAEMPANWGWRSLLVGCLINGRVLKRFNGGVYMPLPPSWKKTELAYYCENCSSIDRLAVVYLGFKGDKTEMVCSNCGNHN